MTRKTTIRLTALALPALLLWIVLLGEANRALDRSTPVQVAVSATAIDGTSYSGPRLQLSGELFNARTVSNGSFSAGAEVSIRYRHDGDDWVFDKLHSPRTRVWSTERIDIPARVESKPYMSLQAVPLAPVSFAITRSTVSEIRRSASVMLTVRRGALGNLWVESAVQTGDSLGDVIGIYDVPGGPPLAFGAGEMNIDPRGLSNRPPDGWIGRIEASQVRSNSTLPGAPSDSVRLADGRIAIAIGGTAYTRNFGFDVVTISPRLEPGELRSSVHFEGNLVSLARDGSVWLAKPALDRSRGGTLRQYSPSGSLLAEVPYDSSAAPFGVQDGFVVSCSTDRVTRFRIENARLVETDHWTVSGLAGIVNLDRDTWIAASRGGIFKLEAGDTVPKLLFSTEATEASPEIHSDAAGNLVIVAALARSPSSQAEDGTGLQHIRFVPQGRPPVDLGSVAVSRDALFYQGQAGSFSFGRRVIVMGDDLYLAHTNSILIYDLSAKKLKTKISQRVSGSQRRLL